MATRKRSADNASPVVQGSLFEEDYLERSLGNIVRDPDYALTELVANAWDAGATRVDITIPEGEGGELIVEDNGCGMTYEEFKKRWMTLGYNRLKHQGKKVEFPPGVEGLHRNAWGRNGVGRHGMLCFGHSYEVITRKADTESHFLLEASSGTHPFVIKKEGRKDAKGHGTILKTNAIKNLPTEDRIRATLSARFVHDPQFVVAVNNISLSLEALPGADNPVFLEVQGLGKIEVQLIDTLKTARTKQKQGFTFWVDNRLVGEPSWSLDAHTPIDGRTTFGKRYTVLVKLGDSYPPIEKDWSGFQKGEHRNALYKALNDYIIIEYQKVSKERIDDTRREAVLPHAAQLKELSRPGRAEIASFVERVLEAEPTIKPESLATAIEAVIKLHQSKSGQRLLQRLSNLTDEDLTLLDKILEEWSVQDAYAVLDEIDRRLAIIKAIEVLSARSDVDELHTLHPLVADSRWVFGPEYDTSEYASNVSLKNAVNKVFSVETKPEHYERWRKRMDLFLKADATLSANAIGEYEDDTSLMKVRKVLLIELKRGDSTIGQKEMTQATTYIQDIRNTGCIEFDFFTTGFVVGHKLDPRAALEFDMGDYAKVRGVTYATLVTSAQRRLFKLREKLEERYSVNASDSRSTKMDELLSQVDMDFSKAS